MMLPQLLHIGPLTVQTYTVLIDLAILLGLGVMAWRGWQLDDEPIPWLDTGLWMLVGGIAGGRVSHILIHWSYFTDHTSEMWQLWQGGINWHGSVAGGLLALYAACLVRHVNFRQVSDLLSLILPAGAALAYMGCLSAHCGYGHEVPNLAFYHPLIAAELPDIYGIVAPRLQTQLFGLLSSIALSGIAWWFSRRIPRIGVRFWLVLTLMGLVIFLIDFTRGDSIPLVGVLRLDQYLDLLVAIAGLAGTYISTRPLYPVAPKPAQSADTH